MADRGRDLRVAIVSDVDDFTTDKPARDLEELGDKADATKRKLDDLADAEKDAGRAGDALARDVKATTGTVDDLGDKGAASAKKLANAFDDIRRSSRQLDAVDKDVKEAGQGLDEFKDEAAGTGREAAASFTGGFEDVTSGIQEVAANAFAGFGPIGAAAGIAAAAGLGIITSKLQAGADKANEVKDRVIELAHAIDDAGGALNNVDLVAKMREWSTEIADNKSWWEVWQESNTTNIEKVRGQAAQLGLDFGDLFRGMSGLDADAAARVLDDINDRLAQNQREIDALGPSTQRLDKVTNDHRDSLYDQSIALRDVRDQLEQSSGVTADATELQQLMADALGDTAKAQQDAADRQAEYGQSLSDLVDPLGAYTQLLDAKQQKERETAQARADATKDEKDSWEDYARTVDVSLASVTAALEQQVADAQAWSDNLGKLAKRGVEDGVLAELERMGPEGAPLVAKLATATGPELDKFVALMERKAALAGAQPAKGIEAGAPAAARAAAGVHAGVVAALKPVDVRVGVSSAGAIAEAEATHQRIQSYFTRNPLTVNVNPKPGQGQGYGVVRARP